MNEDGLISSERTAGRWRSLRDRAVFRLTGSDRVRYLNGQVSNDVAKLHDDESIAACLCTIKGKVEALVWIHTEGEVILLDGEIRQRDFLAARLDRYLIADDCEIEDVTDLVRLIHHFVEDAPGVRSRRIDSPGKDLFLPADASVPFRAAGEIGDDEWEFLETLSLVPRSGNEINAEEFPSELWLDTWAVDFHKGCYLGQEIVSRIRSAGKVNRHLLRVLADSPVYKGESLRITGGFPGLTTRTSSAFTEKNHLSLALVGTRRVEGPASENQRLVTLYKYTEAH